MRIAIVSDIHGNRTAFEAVLADLRITSPDCVLHGGDLADAGSSAAAIVDRIRELGWPGVMGNTDEMLARPESLEEFAATRPAMRPLLGPIREMAVAAREALGDERLAWLGALPRIVQRDFVGLVHASPGSCWAAPQPEASDAELEPVYAPLACPVAVHGHVHRSYIRRLPGLTVVNAGSVSLSYDGDPRAAYLLLDESGPVIRRVEYDVGREIRALRESGMPHAEWVARTLESARPQMP